MANELSTRLMALDVEPIQVESFDDAAAAFAVGDLITAVLLPTSVIEQPRLKTQIKALRKKGPASGVSFAAYGRPPDRAGRKTLRSAGVTLALWEPFDDGTLRFQVNRATTGDREEHGRRAPRVPTYLLARISQGGRTKDAVVYSLSAGGCFLETPRASMEGAQIEVEIRIPGNPVEARGLVRFSNVPGNLQRPNLPLGMGVRFEALSSECEKQLKDYIETRLAQLEV